MRGKSLLCALWKVECKALSPEVMACISRAETNGSGAVLVTPYQTRLLRRADIADFKIFSREDFLATL